MFAAEDGHVDCLKEIIAAGADINIQDYPITYFNGKYITAKKKQGQTALMKAAGKGHVEMCKGTYCCGC